MATPHRALLTSSALCAAATLAVLTTHPGLALRLKRSIAWTNPEHAYVLLATISAQYEIEKAPLDGNPNGFSFIRGSRDPFCTPVALAIGPGGNLYVAGEFGHPCHESIQIFARGASGNV